MLVDKALELGRAPKHKSLLHALSLCCDPDLIRHVVPRLVDCGVKLESRNGSMNAPLLEAIENFGSICVKVGCNRFEKETMGNGFYEYRWDCQTG